MRLLHLFFAVLFLVAVAFLPASAKDFENVSLLGRWAEGPCLAVAVVDEVAYIGNGAILEIVDFHNGLVLQSQVSLPGPILGVSVADGLTCVANGAAGLRVIDAADPALAYEISDWRSPGCAEEVVLGNNLAYVAAGEAGLRVVDLSDLAAPFETGFLDTPGYADDIVLIGGVAYVGDGNSIRIIDVSNAAAPVEIGFVPMPSASEKIVGLDVVGTHAYPVTQYTVGAGERGLRIFDVSDPAAPAQVGYLDTFNEAYDVCVSGTHAFVPSRTAGLRVIDVADPAVPVEVGFVNPDEQLFGVEISDGRAYAASWWDGLTIFDITSPTAPVRVNRYKTHGISDVVAAGGDFAYLNLFGERLLILEMSDQGTPEPRGYFEPSAYAQNLLLEGSFAYVIEGYPDLRIFDLADPRDPVEIGSLQVMGSWVAVDIAISGDYAFLPMRGGHSYTGVQILDISDPTTPLAVSYLNTSSPQCVAAGDGFAYLGDFGELWIIDATDPENPLVACTLDIPARAEDIVLVGDLVYMACYESGLRIVNVSDPYAPYDTGFYDTPGQASSVFVHGDYAYVADGPAGLRVIDVADPTAPVEIGYYDTFDWATAVHVNRGRIYVADRNDGLYILQNDLVSGAPDSDTPSATRLQGIYPNPFNPQLAVSFSLAQPQQTRLAVFDLIGNQIAVIADRMFEPGTHSVQWNGRDASGRSVSSGVYVVRMEAAGLSESRKVTLLR